MVGMLGTGSLTCQEGSTVPTITATREKRARILLAEAPPANGQTRSGDGRPLPALPFVQRNLDALGAAARFLRRSTRPYATVQWLLSHRCGASWNPPLSDKNRPLPGDAHRRACQPWSKALTHMHSSPRYHQACNRPSDQRSDYPLFASGGDFPDGSRAGPLRFQVCVQVNSDVVAERV